MAEEPKRTIAEMEQLIDEGEDIEIRPNGEVVVKDQPAKKAKVLTPPAGPINY